MPIKIDVRIIKDEIRPMLAELKKRMGTLLPLMKNVGELALTSIKKNFEEGGRPRKWQRLKPSTIIQKRREGHLGAGILVRHGFLKSATYKAFSDKVIISNRPEAKDYAAIHHFGGKAGRGHKVSIPDRPFMMLQKEDWVEIKRMAGVYLMKK